ncbi:hypothetical protein AHAS_Ahas13G0218900 [Arachis hypogaea]
MDRHVWTDEETEVFVGFMEELVIEGRIADAGQFRPGSFEKLVAKMNESESLLQQLNSVASSSGKKQGKKPSSFNAAKDTKMMKGLTDTLKYVFDQQETRLDAFAQAMVNTREEKRLVIYLANLDSLMMKHSHHCSCLPCRSSSKHIISAEQVQTLLQYCCLSTHSSCFAGVPSIDGFHVHYISDARPVNAQSIEIGPVNNSIPVVHVNNQFLFVAYPVRI